MLATFLSIMLIIRKNFVFILYTFPDPECHYFCFSSQCVRRHTGPLPLSFSHSKHTHTLRHNLSCLPVHLPFSIQVGVGCCSVEMTNETLTFHFVLMLTDSIGVL